MAEEFGLKLLLLFGSQASGETHAESDFDFAYESGTELDYGQRAKLRIALANMVKRSNVEEVDIHEIGPFLLREIVRNHKLLFSREDAYENFYSYAVRRYLDEASLFALNDSLYLNIADKYKSYAQ